jgi:hypothetical protein
MTRGGATADFRSFVMSLCAVPATLDQDVENETILIDGAPKPVFPQQFQSSGSLQPSDNCRSRRLHFSRPRPHGRATPPAEGKRVGARISIEGA